MKTLFKYIGISSLLLMGFYYTERLNNVVLNNTVLVKKINEESENYNIKSVSAEINAEYIIPGLNGYAVNVLKSYDNMRFSNTFDSKYLEYDIVKPNISLNNNKDKIIKYGNSLKNKVSIIIKDNLEIFEYANKNNLKITRISNLDTFFKNSYVEQINGDYIKYEKMETLLNNQNINKNICYVDEKIKNICINKKKYLVEASYILTKNNLHTIKSKIKSGYIIFINDDVPLSDFKILCHQIYYQNLDLAFLSELINEERD